MGVLGGTTHVLYTSKNGKTGVAGITAKVRKPNGTFIGPFAVTEIVETGFEGQYFFAFNTTLADPEGDYLGVIISPNEGNYRAQFSKLILNKEDPITVVVPRSDEIFVEFDVIPDFEVLFDSEGTELEILIDDNEIIVDIDTEGDLEVILDEDGDTAVNLDC